MSDKLEIIYTNLQEDDTKQHVGAEQIRTSSMSPQDTLSKMESPYEIASADVDQSVEKSGNDEDENGYLRASVIGFPTGNTTAISRKSDEGNEYLSAMKPKEQENLYDNHEMEKRIRCSVAFPQIDKRPSRDVTPERKPMTFTLAIISITAALLFISISLVILRFEIRILRKMHASTTKEAEGTQSLGANSTCDAVQQILLQIGQLGNLTEQKNLDVLHKLDLVQNLTDVNLSTHHVMREKVTRLIKERDNAFKELNQTRDHLQKFAKVYDWFKPDESQVMYGFNSVSYVTYDRSSVACENLGGTLAHTGLRNHTIWSQMRIVFGKSTSKPWIGLRYNSTLEKWVWADGSIENETDWSNNKTGCAGLHIGDDRPLQLSVFDCASNKRKLCQMHV